jgi:hypothetical protein
LLLWQQAPRYTGGNPDLGYHYSALDYTVANAFVFTAGGSVVVSNGTAIATRSEIDTTGACAGFVVDQNAKFIAQGTPEKPIVFTTVHSVQEGPYDSGVSVAFVPDFYGDEFTTDMRPLLSFRFCQFYIPIPHRILLSGIMGFFDDYLWFFPVQQDIALANSAMYLSFQDCAFYGGFLDIPAPTDQFSYWGFTMLQLRMETRRIRIRMVSRLCSRRQRRRLA